MKQILLKTMFLTICICMYSSTKAQTFINKGKIEYEVKTDVKKTMGNSQWEEMLKDKLPRFQTGYYTLTFDNDKSIYEFDHWGEPKVPDYMVRGEDEIKYFYNYNSGSFSAKKNLNGVNLTIVDSIRKLNWRLVNENRVIAGFNCRKAVAVLFDSVYVFAFYTEEIVLPGGPAGFHGLPGAILGITVPRLYTSWLATKLEVTDINTKKIQPVTAKNTLSKAELTTLIKKRMEDWYSSDDPETNKEIQEEKDRMYWSIML